MRSTKGRAGLSRVDLIVKEALKARGWSDAEADQIISRIKNGTGIKSKEPWPPPPKQKIKISGWNVIFHGGYYRAHRRINGKMKTVHLGKPPLDDTTAKAKIIKFINENNLAGWKEENKS